MPMVYFFGEAAAEKRGAEKGGKRMNSIVSFIMALVMLMNVGSAFTGSLESPVFFDVAVETDAAVLEKGFGVLSGGMEVPGISDYVSVAADLLNTLSLRGTAAQNGMQLDVNAKDSNLLSLGFMKDDSGFTIGTTLLGNTRLTLSAETAEQLSAGMESSMGPLMSMFDAAKAVDREKATAALREAVDGVVAKIAEKAGEFESGDFLLEEEFGFTKKAAVDISYQDLVMEILNGFEAYLSHEEFKDLIAAMGENSNPLAEIARLKEEAANMDPDLLFDADVSLYENDEGEQLIVADLHRDAKPDSGISESSDVHMYFGTEFKNTRLGFHVANGDAVPSIFTVSFASADSLTLFMDLQAENGQSFFANAVQTEEVVSAVVGFRAQGIFLRVLVDALPATDGVSSWTAELLLDDENNEALHLLKVSGSSGKGGALTLFDSAEDVETVAVETLLSGGEDAQNTQSALMFSLLSNGMAALTNLIAALPEGTASFLQQLMMSGS